MHFTPNPQNTGNTTVTTVNHLQPHKSTVNRSKRKGSASASEATVGHGKVVLLQCLIHQPIRFQPETTLTTHHVSTVLQPAVKIKTKVRLSRPEPVIPITELVAASSEEINHAERHFDATRRTAAHKRNNYNCWTTQKLKSK